MRGVLIAFEGIDGSGKSLQAKRLARALKDRGFRVLLTAEPTEGVHGRRARAVVKNGRENVSPGEELRAFMDDREEHVSGTVRPALEEGQIVVIDRYYLSTVAYQGALGLDPEGLRRENERRFPVPDRTFLFEVAPDVALERIRAARGEAGKTAFERKGYLGEVDRVFRSIDAPGVVRLSAAAPPERVHEQVLSETLRFLEEIGEEIGEEVGEAGDENPPRARG